MPSPEISKIASILALIGRISPAVFDAFPPHGPAHHSRLDAVSLNPQPLPPGDPYVAASIFMANRLATMAVEAEARGERSEWISEIIDDLCVAPWPRKWPVPLPWPWPGPRPNEGPLPDPWVTATARISAAVIFASVGARLGEGELRASFLVGAERLAEAAVESL